MRIEAAAVAASLLLLAAAGVPGPARSAAAADPAPNAKGILDGKTFQLEIAEQATQSCSREHAIFRAGQFESMECRRYGFSRTPYEAHTAGDSTRFKAVAPSPAEGTNTWNGVVKGNAIHGTLLWEKAGQKPITYAFKGTALPLAAWPEDLRKQATAK